MTDICNKCNGTGWVCENHPDQEAHECKFCGGAGEPCECNPEALMPPGTTVIWEQGKTPPVKDLWEDLMCNTMLYGTGFLKMQMNPQGGFDMSVVPIEDYRYLDARFDKPEEE